MKLIDNEYVTLWYYPDTKIVHHKIHKPIQGPPFRDVLTKGAEILEQHGAQKWLSDGRGNAALHPEDSAWAVNVWAPRVIRGGWKYWALVVPAAGLGKVASRRYANRYADLGVEVKVFEDPSDAMKWLRTPDAPSFDDPDGPARR